MVSNMQQLTDAAQREQAPIAEDTASLHMPGGAPQLESPQPQPQDVHDTAAVAQDAGTSGNGSYAADARPELFEAPPLDIATPQPNGPEAAAQVDAQAAAISAAAEAAAAATGSSVVYPSGAPMPDATGQWYIPMQMLWPAHANGAMGGLISQQQLEQLQALHQQHGHQGHQAYAHLFGAGIPAMDYSHLAAAAVAAPEQDADGDGGDEEAEQDGAEDADPGADASHKRAADGDADDEAARSPKRQHQEHDHTYDQHQHHQEQQLQELAVRATAAEPEPQHAAFTVIPASAQQLHMGVLHMLPHPLDAPQQQHHPVLLLPAQQQQQQPLQHGHSGGMTPTQALAVAPAVRTQRRGQNTEGIKVDDGRIYVPLPLIHLHFAEVQQFPVKSIATVIINDQTVTTNASVWLRRTLNRTRTKGLGNHWLSGLQQVLNPYAGLRLKRVDYNALDTCFLVILTSQGRWTLPVKGVGAAPSSSSMPASHASSAAAAAVTAAAGAATGGVAAGVANGTANSSEAGAEGTTQPVSAAAAQAAVAGPHGAQQFSLEQLMAAGIDVAQLNMLMHASNGAGAAAGDGASEAAHADVPAAEAAAAEARAGTAGSAAAADEAAATDTSPGDAAEASEASPSDDTQAPGRDQTAAGSDAADPNGNTDEAAALDLLLLAGRDGQGAPVGSSGRKARTLNPVDRAATQQAADALTHGTHPHDVARSAAAIAAAATATRMAVAATGTPAEIAAAEAAEAEAVRTSHMAAAFAAMDAAQAANGVQSTNTGISTSIIASALDALARIHESQQVALAAQRAAAAANGHQHHQHRSRTPPPGGGPGGLNPEGGLRIYYGRIYAPLKLVQQHFPNATFPIACKADVWVNDQQLADPLDVRIVAYKKHRRPDQFNYWITGLHKVIQNQTDVRVTGVEWSSERDMFLIHLTVPPQTDAPQVLEEGARIGYYAAAQLALQQQEQQQQQQQAAGDGVEYLQHQPSGQQQQQQQQDEHGQPQEEQQVDGSGSDADDQQQQGQQQEQQQQQQAGAEGGDTGHAVDATSAAFTLQPYGMGGMLQVTRPEQGHAAAATMQQLQHMQHLHNLSPGTLVQYGPAGAAQAYAYPAAAAGADGAAAAGMYHLSGSLQLMQQPGGGLQLVQAGSAVGYPQYGYAQYMGANGMQMQYNPMLMASMGVAVAAGEGGQVDMARVMEAHAQQQAVAEQHHQQHLQQLAALQQLHQQQMAEEQQQAAHAQAALRAHQELEQQRQQEQQQQEQEGHEQQEQEHQQPGTDQQGGADT